MSIEKDRGDVVQATKTFLCATAAWTSLLFDSQAGARLLQVPPAQFERLKRDPANHAEISLDSNVNESVHLIGALAEFAWNGAWPSDLNSLTEALTESATLSEALAGRYFDPEEGDMVPEDVRVLLRAVISAAHARWSLHEGEDVTVEELAALARVAEKTIRMAANRKLEDRLETETGPGNRTFVPPKAALAWLRKRKDYVETRFDAGREGQLSLHSMEELAQLCILARKRVHKEIADLRNDLHWTARKTLTYQNLERGKVDHAADLFSPEQLFRLAEVFQLPDARMFVDQTIRLVITAQAKAKIEEHLRELGGV